MKNLLEALSDLIEEAADKNFYSPTWSRDEENRLSHNDSEANRIIIKEAREFVEEVRAFLEAKNFEDARDWMEIDYERIKNSIEELL